MNISYDRLGANVCERKVPRRKVVSIIRYADWNRSRLMSWHPQEIISLVDLGRLDTVKIRRLRGHTLTITSPKKVRGLAVAELR